MLDHSYAVITAGGGGTRFCPFARRLYPKIMIRPGSEKTLFQQAVERLTGLFPLELNLIVTVPHGFGRVVDLQAQRSAKSSRVLPLLKKSGQNNSYL